MNEEQNPQNPVQSPAQPPAAVSPPAPPAAPAQPVTQIPSTPNDHSALQGAYPAFSANQQSIVASRNGIDEKADEPAFAMAALDFNDSLTLILGLGSAIFFILVAYWVKNLWATVIICGALSGAAIYFAMKTYRKTQNITPQEVIGISAATITIVEVGTLIVSHLLVRSLY